MTPRAGVGTLPFIQTHPRSPWAVTALVASVGALLATAVLVGIGSGASGSDEVGEWLVACFAPGFLVSGWWLVRRRPSLSLGWLFLAAGCSVAFAGAAAAWTLAARAEGWPGTAWSLWVFSWLWQPHSVLLGVALLLFPDGVARGRFHRLLVWAMLVPLAASMALSVVQPGVIVTTPDHLDGSLTGLVNPVGVTALSGSVDVLQGVVLALGGLSALIPLVWASWWWWRSTGERRRQFRWVTLILVATSVAPVVVFGAPGAAGPVLAILSTLATQVLVVVAVLQWQAYEVEVAVRRSVLAVSVLAVALAPYVIVVVLASVVVGSTGTAPGAIGATVAALAFGPLSTRIRAAVNRLFYGRRDDPYSVVGDLGRQLAAAVDPLDGLTAAVVALASALRLPYAAVVGVDDRVLAATGTLEEGDVPAERPLVHRNAIVGVLRVGHRRGSDELLTAEVELLDNLARQIGATVVAGELLEGLRTAQERLVLARQDERRRIQRDLHDGLGPELTAVVLKLDAARNHLAGDAVEQVDELVGSARRGVSDALGDVRRLVYSLGDPTLANLGLGAATRDHVRSLTQGTGLLATVDVDDLPDLPAATEEAAYRIVGEAVTNVARHAGATACRVALSFEEGALVAVIEDDGCGIDPAAALGVGRRSMQERAAELAGDLVVGPGPNGGTIVRLRLPLGAMP